MLFNSIIFLSNFLITRLGRWLLEWKATGPCYSCKPPTRLKASHRSLGVAYLPPFITKLSYLEKTHITDNSQIFIKTVYWEQVHASIKNTGSDFKLFNMWDKFI